MRRLPHALHDHSVRAETKHRPAAAHAGHLAANLNRQTGGTHAPTAVPTRHRPPGPRRPDRAAPGRLLGQRRLGSHAGPHHPGGPAELDRQAHHPDPRNGQTISRQSSEVRLSLHGAKIISKTTTRIRPDQGHIHLLVDGKLVAMNYGLDEQLPNLTAGQHLVQVEFVAADHAPFDPRVLTQAAFTVRP